MCHLVNPKKQQVMIMLKCIASLNRHVQRAWELQRMRVIAWCIKLMLHWVEDKQYDKQSLWEHFYLIHVHVYGNWHIYCSYLLSLGADELISCHAQYLQVKRDMNYIRTCYFIMMQLTRNCYFNSQIKWHLWNSHLWSNLPVVITK